MKHNWYNLSPLSYERAIQFPRVTVWEWVYVCVRDADIDQHKQPDSNVSWFPMERQPHLLESLNLQAWHSRSKYPHTLQPLCTVKHYHSFSQISPQPHTFSNCPYQHNIHLCCIIHWCSASVKCRRLPLMWICVICPALWFSSMCCLVGGSEKQQHDDTSLCRRGSWRPLWSNDWLNVGCGDIVALKNSISHNIARFCS